MVDNASYTVQIGECPFFEINKNTYISTIMKSIAEKFLQKQDEDINEILVRAQGRDSCKKIRKLYKILRERFIGVSTIYHKCKTTMKSSENGQFKEDSKSKKTIEVIFIKNPSDRQKSMEGFKKPQQSGQIMDYDHYEKTYILINDIDSELKVLKEDEQQLAKALYIKQYLHNNHEPQSNQMNDQNKEEQQQYSESELGDDEYDEDYDEDHEQGQKNNYYDNLSHPRLLQKVEQKSQQLNPHLKVMQKHDLNLTSGYMLTLSAIRPSPEKIEEMKQESEKTMQGIHSKIENLNQTNRPISSLSSEDQRDIVKGLLFQLYNGLGHNVQITNKDTQQNSHANCFQSQLIMTGQTKNIKYLQLNINDEHYTHSRIISDPKQYSEFINKFLAAAEIQYGVPKSQVTILGIQKGNGVEVHYNIHGLENDHNLAINEFQKTFLKAKISLIVQSLIDNYQIDNSYFDEKYNMNWAEFHKTFTDYRGSLPRKQDQKNLVPQKYNFPVGFQGYGINVQKWLNEDKKWFGSNSDPSVWIVLYHGTDSQGFQGITKSFIQPGSANYYGGKTCRLTGQIIKSGSKQNTYFSDLAYGKNSAEEYCTKKLKFGKKEYQVMFQCRVNPSCVRSPEERPNYYTVESQYAEQNVRPYRVLLKEF